MAKTNSMQTDVVSNTQAVGTRKKKEVSRAAKVARMAITSGALALGWLGISAGVSFML